MTEIRLFVDDERTAFAGWTLARTVREAMAFFDDDDTETRITHLSLDYYLGNGLNGAELAREMVARVFYLKLPIFEKLEIVYFHSSDRTFAMKQVKIFEEAKTRGIIPQDCRFRINPQCRTDYGIKGEVQ